MELLSNIELEKLSPIERKAYYMKLREKCLDLSNHQLKFGQDIIKKVYPLVRKYEYEFEGTKNIPNDSNALFLVNHSNSHDIFTAYEVLSAFQRQGSVMVATDCLNPLTTEIFNISNATLLDRRKKEDRKNAILMLSSKILSGKDGVIFGESTWNLHPILPMHNIRTGISIISAITQTPIIPTIFEYVEEDGIINSEAKLYKKCIIRFGKATMIDYDKDLISQTNNIRNNMSDIRTQIWKDNNIQRSSLSDIDPLIYLNHTYLKKFKALGFTYDSQAEQEFLLFLNGEIKENEYTIDDNGNFVSGITHKNFQLKKLFHQ